MTAIPPDIFGWAPGEPLTPSQAADPVSFMQGHDVAANLYPMIADDGRAEGRAEERGLIAGWLLEQGHTDLGIRLLDYADREGPAHAPD